MGKKAKTRKRKTQDARDARDAERQAREVAALVYAAYGFDPTALSTVPDGSPVRAATREEARAALVAVGLLSQHDFQVLPVADATAVAVARLLGTGAAPE
jgi:hypothetical protein